MALTDLLPFLEGIGPTAAVLLFLFVMVLPMFKRDRKERQDDLNAASQSGRMAVEIQELKRRVAEIERRLER